MPNYVTQPLIDKKLQVAETRTEAMHNIGIELSKVVNHDNTNPCLLIATAEDADYLMSGVLEGLNKEGITDIKIAVFWNNHYTIPSTGESIAPITSLFTDKGYEDSTTVIIVKSIISGSCVVRTNLTEILSRLKVVKDIYILAPVALKGAEKNLKKSFKKDISDKFIFKVCAVDKEKASDGTVLPGIGGQVYERLGLSGQPALTGYIPDIVLNRI